MNDGLKAMVSSAFVAIYSVVAAEILFVLVLGGCELNVDLLANYAVPVLLIPSALRQIWSPSMNVMAVAAVARDGED